MNGALRLRAELRGCQTALSEVFRTPPFVVGPPSYRSGVAEIIVQQVSPGLFPAEVHTIEITVAAGARLIVRGQSATKIYPCPEGETARINARYTVEADAELVLLPGELIPFADSALMQATEVALARGARFITGEVITPGRMAMGECNLYRRLDLRTNIRRDDRIVLLDRTLIEPATRSPQRLGVQGEFPCAGSLYLAGFGDRKFEEIGVYREADLWWAAGQVDDLTTVRFLGRRAADILAKRDEIIRRALSLSVTS